MGFALGRVGLRYSDFARLTPDEFLQVCRSYDEGREASERGEWERTRVLASIMIQPYMKKRVKPAELLPFPWDKAKAEIRSLEEDRAALARLRARLGGRG